jgi:hypothetical protein
MTRKHYNAIAEEMAFLLRASQGERREGIVEAVKILASTLKADNSAFDKQRFFTACGI